QERPALSRDEQIRDLENRAREAYKAQNYGVAADLATKARALREGAASNDVQDERPLPPPTPGRYNAGRTPARPVAADPKALVELAKQAMAQGDYDKAQELAAQARANAAGVRWGLFDDTPDSILRDIQKARGRREKDAAEKLLTEARLLVEKPAPTIAERAANLSAAEEKAKQAAAMHGSYSMLDFGDRPAPVPNDLRRVLDGEQTR